MFCLLSKEMMLFWLFMVLSWVDGKNDHNYKLNNKPHDVPLALNGGWYSFQFEDVGSTSNSHFTFELPSPALFKIVDYFCSGDRFYIKDNNNYLGPTGHVEFDNCNTNTTNPDYAWSKPHKFSAGSFRLEPGWHNISIKVTHAHYGGGSAAARLDPILVQCALKTANTNDFVLIDTPLPFDQALTACESLDLTLADIGLYKTLASATDLAFQCIGPFRKAWIRSFYGDDYGQSCLAVRTKVMAPGGEVGIEEDCQIALPILCMSKKFQVP
jgi:hypothetical protein